MVSPEQGRSLGISSYNRVGIFQLRTIRKVMGFMERPSIRFSRPQGPPDPTGWT
jgi:hypothetical protein